MSNPDVQSVLRSQEYYRLKQVVQSPGDIYELEQSAKAIYIGPDSDIAEVSMQYFNPDEPLGLETAVISVNGPFVGRVDSLPHTNGPLTGQPARILLSPVDLVDNTYIPPSSVALRRFNIPTVIDVMVALKQLPDIPSVRADRTLRFPSVPYDRQNAPPPFPVGNDGSTELLVPIYGRRMVTVTILGNDWTADLSLVTLQPGIATGPRFLGSIGVGASIPVMIRAQTAVIRASDAARHGETFDVAGVANGSYNESDQPTAAGPGPVPTFFPVPRGMADLLLIRITDRAGIAVAATRFVDVYVKVADRES